jgi:hypothetical protein
MAARTGAQGQCFAPRASANNIGAIEAINPIEAIASANNRPGQRQARGWGRG